MTRTLRKGQAKVQFLAHKEEICKLLECGHSMIETLEILQQKHTDITMKYQTFRRLVFHYIGEEILIQHRHSGKSKSNPSPVPVSQERVHQSPQQTHFLRSESSFQKAETIDPNNLV